jgi:group I intron endonuclease
MKTNNNIINVPYEVQATYKDLILNKDTIKSEMDNVSGIYVFKNDLSEDPRDLYIGSAIDISKRFDQHMRNYNSNLHFQNSMNKYGKENFSFCILEYSIYDLSLSKRENALLLLILEQKYLDLMKPNYNINPSAESRLGAKHNERTKELMKQMNIGDKNPFYGKTHSDEFKEFMKVRMSGSNNPMAGKLVTELVKQAIKDTKNQRVYLYDSNTKELIKVYSSQVEFIKELHVSPKTVIKYLKSGEVWRDKYFISSSILDKN